MPQVINTNIMSLNAQRQLDKSQRAQNQAMERLSSGLRVNSAKDDAAGLSIATGMESQTRGLNQAIRNANDGISMAQTAEGAMDEMTNIMQRMRELAVQSANDTNSASNRASIQKEVDQLYSELDRIANTTQFNGVVLLNGSAGQTNLQIGANSGESLSFNIDAVTSKDLNLNAVSGLGELNGGRIDSTVAISANSITINDVTITGATGAMNAQAMETAINAEKGLTGVTANAYNVLNGTGNQNGVTAGLTINTVLLGATASMQDLVNKINQEVPGVVASIDKQGGLSLSNDTGAAITIANGAQIGMVNGTYDGFLALTSADGTEIKTGLSATGKAADLHAIGFNVSQGSDEVTGSAVSTAAVTASDGIMINGIKVGDITGASAADKAFAINALRSETGVEATARTEAKFQLAVGTNDANFRINGTSATAALSSATTLDEAITNINALGLAGVVASADKTTGELVLTSQSGQDIRVNATAGTLGAAAYNDTIGNGALGAGIIGGQISLKGDSGRDVVVTSSAAGQAAQSTALAKLGLTSQGGDETAIGSGLSVLTAANASNTIERIDDALNKISDSRSSLGAVQNRLTSTISNLANVSQNTAAAKSRIMDADFAAETSQMSKAQVLQQAGTAMLAQANASNQGVLSLLKG
ncbi:flagellin N-terminal helical domain-containing protein [Pseudaeromonas pectinilytica]